jgi:hypothetical protein
MYYLCVSTAHQQPKGGNILFVRGEMQGQDTDGTDTTRVVNPDEINIDMDDEDEDEEDEADDSEYTLQPNFICSICVH